MSKVKSSPLLRLTERLPMRLFVLTCVFSLFLSSALAAGPVSGSGQTQQAASYAATAVYSTAPNRVFKVEGESNKLAAASAAQSACVEAHPPQSPKAYCELVQLADTSITTAAQLRASVPATPHPLYLWRFRQGQATVYLAGSVHILKTGLYPLPPQYLEAFERSQNLVLEVDLSAYTPQQMQQKTLQYAMLQDNQTAADILAPEQYAALHRLTREYGLDLDQLRVFKPAFITQQVAVLSMMALGYDPAAGVEKYFTDRIGARQILQLEDIDFQLNLLMNQSLEVQRAMVSDLLDQVTELEPLMTSLLGAWLSGDDASFAAAFTAQSGTSPATREFMRQLMDERNVGMAEKIESYLNTSGAYFVLIGAGHYVGENNVIELLQQRGIKGTRIYSDDSL